MSTKGQYNVFVDSSWGSSTTGNVLLLSDEPQASALPWLDRSLSHTTIQTKLESGIETSQILLGNVGIHSKFNLGNENDGIFVPKVPGDFHTIEEPKVNLTLVRLSKSAKKISATGVAAADCQCLICHGLEANCVTPCKHTFHVKCAMRWFRAKQNCPVCRSDVEDIEPVKTEESKDTTSAIESQDTESSGSPSSESTSLLDMLSDDDAHTEDEQTVNSQANSQVSKRIEDDLQDRPSETKEWSLESDSNSAESITDSSGQKSPGSPMDDVALSCETLPEPAITQVADTPAFLTSQHQPQSTLPNYWHVMNAAPQAPLPASLQCAFRARTVTPIAPRPDDSVDSRPGEKRRPPLLPSCPSKQARTLPIPVTSCKCIGGCRNGRCACVKEGGVCGAFCGCTSCRNPWVAMAEMGLIFSNLQNDICLMQNLSKIKNMKAFLTQPVKVECCGYSTAVLNCTHGYQCPKCSTSYTYSWCQNKLCDTKKEPRTHCSKCKRCGDHRNVHCEECNKCFFAGVNASFPCPCKESKLCGDESQPDGSKDGNASASEDEPEQGCVVM